MKSARNISDDAYKELSLDAGEGRHASTVLEKILLLYWLSTMGTVDPTTWVEV